MTTAPLAVLAKGLITTMVERQLNRCPGRVTGRLVCVLLLLIGLSVRADDWPEFRGPTGQGLSVEHGLAAEWSESRNVVWKTPVLGSGWSSPVVADGRVWVTTAIDEGGGSLRAVAFDSESGRELVNVEVFRIADVRAPNPKNSLASPTPVVDGDHVYVHFGAFGTAALTTAGDVVWTRRFPYDSQHGNGGSPVLYEDLLILSCGWIRHRLRCRPRHADGGRAVEDRAAATLFSGLLDASGDSCRGP